VLILLGFSVPEVLYDSSRATRRAREREEGGETVAAKHAADASQATGFQFLVGAYGLGYFFTYLPQLILSYFK